MSSSYFKNEEKLVDASNFLPWKAKLDITLEEHDILGYVEGEVAKLAENSNAAIKARYKKGEVKDTNIIVDSLGDHLITYVSNLKKSKELYATLIGMYQVNNLVQILALKNHLKDVKMNKGETIQAYFGSISKIKDQLSTFGEVVSDKELVLIMLGGLPSWENFITTISNKDKFPTFDELLGKCSEEEEVRMISRGRITKHKEGEPTPFAVQGKKKEGRRGMLKRTSSFLRLITPKDLEYQIIH